MTLPISFDLGNNLLVHFCEPSQRARSIHPLGWNQNHALRTWIFVYGRIGVYLSYKRLDSQIILNTHHRRKDRPKHWERSTPIDITVLEYWNKITDGICRRYLLTRKISMQEILKRLKNNYDTYGCRGILFAAKSRILPSNSEVKVKPPCCSTPVILRTRSTDVATYHQIFIDSEYDIDLAKTPRVIVDAGAIFCMKISASQNIRHWAGTNQLQFAVPKHPTLPQHRSRLCRVVEY